MNKFFIIIISIFSFSFISASEIYKIGVEDISYYPHYVYENGDYRGFGADILKDFAKSKGYIFEFVPKPIVRLVKDYVDGEVDFVYPDNAYWSSEAKEGMIITYSNPVAGYIDGVMVLPENSDQTTIENLGIVIGFTPFEYLNAINKGDVKLVKNPSLIGLVQQGIKGRVEGIYGNIDIIDYILKERLNHPNMLVFNQNLPYTKSHYHLSTIKYPKIIEEFNQYLQENSQKINELREQYGIKDY